MLVAIEMPTVAGGAGYDFSTYSSGRVSPTLDQALAMANGNRKAKRGSYLKYSWRSALDANGASDHLGELDPLTVSKAASLATCADFSGNLFFLQPLSFGMYGDAVGSLKPQADTFGYLRSYDIGACSAAANLRQFAADAATELSQKIVGIGAQGPVNILIDEARFVMLPALVDQVPTGPMPYQPGALPHREPGAEGLDFWFEADGYATTSVAGADVGCSFDLSYRGDLTVQVEPGAPRYWQRVRMLPSDDKPVIDVHDCHTDAEFEFLVEVINLLSTSMFGGFLDLEIDLDAMANDAVNAGSIRGRFIDRFHTLTSELNESLMLPLPASDSTSPQQLRVVFDEWAQRRGTSPQLLHRDPGPAGSCVAADLKNLDAQKCTLSSIQDLLAQLASSNPRLADAIARLVQYDPKSLECRPIRGGSALAKPAWTTSKYDDELASERTLAHWISRPCQSGAERLFVVAGELIQGCVDDAGGVDCHACYQYQDAGEHCDFEKLLEAGCVLPVGIPSWIDSPNIPSNPQVLCSVSPGAAQANPSLRCVPRYSPSGTNTVSERNAMCVPIAGVGFSGCEPCLALTVRDAAAEEKAACLTAPSVCRVGVGQMNASSCDARLLATELSTGKARVPTPFRCGLRLPLSRVEVEPDRINVVLAESFPCPDGLTPPCTVQSTDDLTYDQAAAVLWEELTKVALLAGATIAAPGLEPPSCFPARRDVLNQLDQDTWLASPPMGFLGQVARTFTGWKKLTNSPLCGWVPRPPYYAPLASAP